MIDRLLQLPKEKSFFLFGPRQTGKTALINSVFQHKVYKINLLLTDQFLKYSKDPSLFRKEQAGVLTGAYEIKWSRTIDTSQLTGLRSFRQDYPEVQCHVICNTDEPYHIGNVLVMNWKQFITKAGEQWAKT